MFRSRKARTLDALAQLAVEQKVRHQPPIAMHLKVVNNGDQGWKWLTFDYDPEGKKLMAGAVEGVLVPHGIQSGFGSDREALIRGIEAIRRAGWHGDIMLSVERS